MKKPQHLSDEVLVRLLDDELPQEEAIAAQSHVDICAECRHRYAELRGASNQFEAFAGAIRAPFAESERDGLSLLLNTHPQTSSRRSDRVLQRLVWGMAIAASLLLGLLVAPHLRHEQVQVANGEVSRSSASLLEVDGETFVPLPYSNPDLPVPTHRIVEMQIPVSSLVDAGVHFEAISNEASSSDESVLADVLLGIDGQPLGVHVLGTSN
jgi:hypothetical protein